MPEAMEFASEYHLRLIESGNTLCVQWCMLHVLTLM